MHNYKVFFLAPLTVLALSACSDAQEQLGLTKDAPDEFQVVKRAPLELPPDYSLRPPRPGAPRPQEKAPIDQARQTVFGAGQETATAPTTGEGALLHQAGARAADPDIRKRVDAETSELGDRNQATIDKILSLGGGGTPSASVVNAKEEAERLKKNAETGQPVTEGETPTIEE